MVLRGRSILPGFGLSMGYAVLYLSLIVLLPLSMLFVKASAMEWSQLWSIVSSERALASYRLSFGTAFIASLVNVIFGFLVAWVLVRYRFPGRNIIDAMIDLPFALPTAVAGIALTALFTETGWIGKYLAAYGIKVAFTPLGIIVALIFIGLPFVVRTVQSVLEEMNPEYEEAASSLGANRVQIFLRIVMPGLWPAVITGFALAFARTVGEYGSVVFISGNMPMKTEIAPFLIMTRLEQFDYPGATAIAVVMLLISFFLLFVINLLQWWSSRRLA